MVYVRWAGAVNQVGWRVGYIDVVIVVALVTLAGYWCSFANFSFDGLQIDLYTGVPPNLMLNYLLTYYLSRKGRVLSSVLPSKKVV